jgi:nitronate monooxygenase
MLENTRQSGKLQAAPWNQGHGLCGCGRRGAKNMKTLAQKLGVTHPLIQAPMANSQGSALALAVSRAGALGSLPCAALTVDALRAELDILRAQAAAPINLNFFCHEARQPDAARERAWRDLLAPYYRELGLDPSEQKAVPQRMPFDAAMADVIEPYRPRVVSFHFGLPAPALLERVKRWGALVMSSATTVEEARWLEAHGADVIIAQGFEAGGHRATFLSTDLHRDMPLQQGTFALLPQVVQAVRVPVVAAGGIADCSGIRAALALGAQGVQLGTTYLCCPEANTTPVHRAALQRAQPTEVTNLFTGRPARGIVNRLMRELGALNRAAPPFPLATPALAPLRAASERMHEADFSPLWCGQNPSGCTARPAEELTRELCRAFA